MKQFIFSVFVAALLLSTHSSAEDTTKAHILEDGIACHYEHERFPINISFTVKGRERFVCIYQAICEKAQGGGTQRSIFVKEQTTRDSCEDFANGSTIKGAGPRASLLPHLEPLKESQPTKPPIAISGSRGEKALYRTYVGRDYPTNDYGTCVYTRGGLPGSLDFRLTPEPDSKVIRSFCYVEANCTKGGIITRTCEKRASGECPLLSECLNSKPMPGVHVASVNEGKGALEADLQRMIEEDKTLALAVEPAADGVKFVGYQRNAQTPTHTRQANNSKVRGEAVASVPARQQVQ